MPITAIGVYMDWMDAMVCLAVPPKTLDWEQAQNIASAMPEVILFKDEAEMLKVFLQLIDDADILSGWNSEGYDIPYTINPIIKVLGKSETPNYVYGTSFQKKDVMTTLVKSDKVMTCWVECI